MLRFRPLFFLFLSAITFISAASAQEKVELRLRLEAGQVFDQVVAMQQKVSQTYSGTRTDWATTTRFGTHNEILRADEKGAVIKTTYIYATSEVSINPQQVERYDSRKPPKVLPYSAMAVAGFVGQSLTTTVSARGDVLKIEGMEAVVKRMFDLMKLPSDVRALISKAISEASKTQPGQFIQFAQLPENAVAIGDSWTAKNNRSGIAPSFDSTRYTLFAQESQGLILSLHSSVLAPSTTDFQAQGSQSGILHIDESSGLISRYEIHQRIAGRIEIKSQVPDVPNAKVVVITPKTKTITKITSWPIYSKTTFRGWTVAPPRANQSLEYSRRAFAEYSRRDKIA